MIPETKVEEWVSKIGNYELDKDSPREQREANFDIDLFLTPEAQAKLYESTHSEDVEPTAAREQFIRFLYRKFKDIERNPHLADKTVQLADFLDDIDEDGLALYKAAVEEESKSKAFRDAVFFKSLKHYPGNKWAQRMVLWVGGPSSSGKTYGAKGAVEKMSRDVLKKTTEEGGNDIVSVDGSFERETSQMRQMVLQFALATGYKGIQDLHTHSKDLTVKKYVREAALEDKRLSLVIPDTFVRNPKEIRKEFKAYEKAGVVQAFSEVKAEKGYQDRFQTSVKKMGDARAWNNKVFTESQIAMNNRNIGCESKVYEGHYFKFGLHMTKIFKKFYKAYSRDKVTLTIMNDLIYLVKRDNAWQECEYSDNLDNQIEGIDFIRMPARAYNYWRDNKIAQPLETWFEETGKHIKSLTEQVITDKKNEKYSKHHSFFNLLRVSSLRELFIKDVEKEQRRLRHQIAVNEDMITALEEEIDTLTADTEVAELLSAKLETCKLLQASLKENLNMLSDPHRSTTEAMQFLPYIDSYVDIPISDKEELLQQTVRGDTPSIAITSETENQGEFLAPQLKDDYCRVHYVDLSSAPATKAMFVQEKNSGSERGFTLSAVEESIDHEPTALFEYSLAMASSLLLGLDTPPTEKKPVTIQGWDRELLAYMWTALVVLGEKTSGMKFPLEAISVFTTAFTTNQEMMSDKKFSPQSLHETIFKTHEAFVNLKVKELESLLKLKSDPEAQAKLLNQELVEATQSLQK
ncbi:hypothetical protein [Legionella cardiaca]|uniref:Coiled-coil protein n=1 Tax=Legionella cardiaca TaxID=1071983 RepID=A0ABY8ASA5_9GAMM|nr:hypothetical protein [Legionella cardiaca]WED43564.1 hypothetical protein PXX05_01960 [Legionella cardiaca]